MARSVALQMSKGGGMLAGCHVVDGLQASSGGAHGFSRGEGGLEGLSLLRLFKGLRELRSVARRRSRRQCAHGQRAACRVVAVWLMAFKQAALGGAAGTMVSEHSRAACCRVVDGPKQWWYGFGSRPQRPLLATLDWEGQGGALCGDRLRYQPLWLMARSELA